MQQITEAPVVEPRTVRGDEGVGGATICLKAASFRFGGLEVLDRLDLEVPAGEVLGLVGPSGCGKSTLLELIAGLVRETDGSVLVDGESAPTDRVRHCALMPQRDVLLPWLSAIDNAALALRNRGASRSRSRAGAHSLFQRFGLAGFEATRPAGLSGGMRQRVAFLRTLLAEKPVLLLDEPFASLDAITRGEMQEWLATALATESRTAVLVTHDVEEALYLCDRVAVLSARPARVLAEVRAPGTRLVPRLASITSPRFVEARERALAALYEGRR